MPSHDANKLCVRHRKLFCLKASIHNINLSVNITIINLLLETICCLCFIVGNYEIFICEDTLSRWG